LKRTSIVSLLKYAAGEVQLNFPPRYRDVRRAAAVYVWRPEYYRDILNTPPVRTGSDSGFDLHVLVCRKDFVNMFWSLKSLFHFSRLRPGLVIHEDGSLGRRHLRLIEHHFPEADIITKREADELMKKVLPEGSMMHRCRFESYIPFSIKLLDTLMLPGKDSIMVLDPDVVFFSRPSEIEDAVESGDGFYLRDRNTCYALDTDRLEYALDLKMLPAVNSGLYFVPDNKELETGSIERFLKLLSDGSGYRRKWIEQTGVACLLSRRRDVFSPLDSKRYSISTNQLHPDVACHHYTGLVRRRLYVEAAPVLRKKLLYFEK